VTSAFTYDGAAMLEEVLLQRSEPRHEVQTCTTPRPASNRVGYARTVTTDLTWTAVFETVEEGWVQARVAELPGVITTAPSLGEAKALLLDAVREYLLSLRQEPPEPTAESAVRESLHVVIDAA
jgi:predicted RNase H-like HicB family nuclease